MAEYLIKGESLTAIANEVRDLSGITETMSVDEMTSTLNTENSNFITNISTQDDIIAQIQVALEGKTASGNGTAILPTLNNPATPSDILSGKEAINGNGSVITGNIATVAQATPSVSINSSGLITATATQTAGYVSAGSKSGTKQLTTQAAKTITPSTSSQTAVASGVYTTGTVTVGAIPSTYIKPSGTKNITINGTHDVKTYESVSVSVASTGEDVTAETNAYTEKITQLTTAVTALENELAGKASGGSGGSIETCNVTISTFLSVPVLSVPTFYYTNASTLTVQSVSTANCTITVPLNSIIVISEWTSYSASAGSCKQLFYGYGFAAYEINGDCTLKYAE